MKQDSQIILVSPSAHYPSHNWPITVALFRALRQKNLNVRIVIFSTGTEPVPPDLEGSVDRVFSQTPRFWRRAVSGKWQERKFSVLTHLYETIMCLLRARKLSRQRHTAAMHFLSGSYWVVVLAALRMKRLRFVYSLYGRILLGSSTGLRGWIRSRLIEWLKKAVASGRLEFTCENDFLRTELVPVLGSHIHTIPYAIDDSEPLPTQAGARQRLNLPPNDKIILFFGTHRREKDYRTALKGCLILPQPPLALFVGKVISSNDPKQIVAECHYPHAQVVDEFVPEQQAKDYFAAADVVALPYEADFSRGSGVLIECCRYLRPMIATATPYLSQFLSCYDCGVSYAAGNADAFGTAAINAFTDPERFRPGLERARNDHSWTVAAEKYNQLYRG